MGKITKTAADFSAGGIVWDAQRKKILLVRVENLAKEKVWTFPKGHPERGESDEAAAIREVREETGWACRVRRKLKDVSYYFVRDNVRYHKTVRWFLMTPDKKEGDFDPREILDCGWFDLTDVSGIVRYPSDKDLIRSFPGFDRSSYNKRP